MPPVFSGLSFKKMNTRFKPKFNIKKGDQVVVIAGNDRDRSNPREVLAVYPLKSRVLVAGVNIVTKHLKPSAKNPQGGIVKEEAPIHISNVQLWDAKSKAPSRIRRERKDGTAIRIFKKSGQELK